MKKVLYILLAIVTIGAVAFLLSNTNLFKGDFTDFWEGPQYTVESSFVYSADIPTALDCTDEDPDTLCDLQDAIAAANESIEDVLIEFDESVISVSIEDATPLEDDESETLVITNTAAQVVIDFEDRVTLQTTTLFAEGHLSKLLKMNAGTDLRLVDMTLSNSTNGIENAGGTLSIENGTFQFNAGYVVLNSTADSHTTITNGLFDQNELQASSDNEGLIVSRGGTVTIEDSTFTDNSNTDNVAGIAIHEGDLTINNSVFSDFTVTEAISIVNPGGAIYKTGNGDLEIASTSFLNNMATRGAAIYIDALEGTNNTITGAEGIGMANNTASSSGGAIFKTGPGAFNLNSIALTANEAPYGGAIYIGSPHSEEESPSVGEQVFNDVVVTENHATESGGGLYNSLYPENPLTIERSFISSNIADDGEDNIHNVNGDEAIVNIESILGDMFIINIDLKDEAGDEIENLTEENFLLTSESDSEILNFTSNDEDYSRYQILVNYDEDHTITIQNVTGFVDKVLILSADEVYTIDEISPEEGELDYEFPETEVFMDHAYLIEVPDITNDEFTTLEWTITANDTACTYLKDELTEGDEFDSSVFTCLVPLMGDGEIITYSLERLGDETIIIEESADARTAHADAQIEKYFRLEIYLDPDGDGLTNDEESALGTSHLDPDTDDGGEWDGSEVEAGRDPFEPLDDIPAIPEDAEFSCTITTDPIDSPEAGIAVTHIDDESHDVDTIVHIDFEAVSSPIGGIFEGEFTALSTGSEDMEVPTHFYYEPIEGEPFDGTELAFPLTGNEHSFDLRVTGVKIGTTLNFRAQGPDGAISGDCGAFIGVREDTDFDEEAPIITLLGEEELTVYIGEEYTDAGVTVIDDVEGDISDQVRIRVSELEGDTFDVGEEETVSDYIDTSTPAIYTIEYKANDRVFNYADPVYRFVTVTEIPYEFSCDLINLIPSSFSITEEMSGVADTDIEVSLNISGEEVVISFFPNWIYDVLSFINVYTASDHDIWSGTLHFSNNNLDSEFTFGGLIPEEDIIGSPIAVPIVGNNTLTTVYHSGIRIGDIITARALGNGVDCEDSIIVTEDLDGAPDTTPPSISLFPPDSIEISKGAVYEEPGYSATDNVDGFLTDNVVLGGTFIDTSTVGTFTLTYDVSDSAGNPAIQKTRNITIVDDISAPVITLIGANETIEIDSIYEDLGATATDDVDGDITDLIIVGGDTVNSSIVGVYTMTYNVSDTAGNPAIEVIRTVTVLEEGVGLDATPPVITLVEGDKTLLFASIYTEPGATATDDRDGDLTDSIVIGGEVVDTNIAGEYLLTYNVSDVAGNPAVEVIRTVTVLADGVPLADTTPPVITMNGSDEIMPYASAYADQGATATDDTDGDITDQISVNNPVNNLISGVYYVTYNVSDAAGNPALEVRRRVEVQEEVTTQVDPDPPLETDDDKRQSIIDAVNTCRDPFIDTHTGEPWYEKAVCIGYSLGIAKGKTNVIFDPAGTVTRAELLAFILRAAGISEYEGSSLPVNYADVSDGDWYRNLYALDKLYNITHVSDGGFVNPNLPATRADMVVWEARLYGLTSFDYDITKVCNDIRNSDPWAYAFAIMTDWIVEFPTGFTTPMITGYPDGSCKPQGYTNRAEAITYVLRAYTGLGQISSR
ncbi:DUF5011 domain-containing protein [Candidatus Peregrinibacteria bacterium]|jgi:hypothetical protein|nr:DUF5011 domain-containing protein [Candidatus Peregrinibacteria bacterium]